MSSVWDDLHHVVNSVGTVVNKVIKPVGAALTGLTNPVATVFGTLGSVATTDIKKTQNLLGQVAKTALYITKKKDAQEIVKKYEGLIGQFVAEANMFAGLEDVLGSCAAKRDSATAQKAIKAALGEANGVMSEIEKLSSADLLTLTFEVSGQADLIVGADGSVGYAVAVPDFLVAKPYASVGITLGAEEGGEAGIVVGMSPQKPDDQSGPFVGISVEVDAALGGGLAVSFNLPDLSFGGVSVDIKAGEEVQVAGSGGYTWAL